MTIRSLFTGAVVAIACLAVSAAFTDASAEMKKKKPGGGAGICVSKPQPDCNLFLKATCTEKSRCGGCLKWVCKL